MHENVIQLELVFVRMVQADALDALTILVVPPVDQDWRDLRNPIGEVVLSGNL